MESGNEERRKGSKETRNERRKEGRKQGTEKVK